MKTEPINQVLVQFYTYQTWLAESLGQITHAAAGQRALGEEKEEKRDKHQHHGGGAAAAAAAAAQRILLLLFFCFVFFIKGNVRERGT